jgi:site-specific recombinase XerD
MGYMNLPEAIKTFIVINKNHLAEKTIEGYERSLMAFSTWLEENAAGVDAIHNPHAWRHTNAKLSIMNGADLTMVQRFLGHRSIKITADYYAHFATDELAKLHDQVSPVAGLTNGENG